MCVFLSTKKHFLIHTSLHYVCMLIYTEYCYILYLSDHLLPPGSSVLYLWLKKINNNSMKMSLSILEPKLTLSFRKGQYLHNVCNYVVLLLNWENNWTIMSRLNENDYNIKECLMGEILRQSLSCSITRKISVFPSLLPLCVCLRCKCWKTPGNDRLKGSQSSAPCHMC